MKRSTSAPCLADEDDCKYQRKRAKGCNNEVEGPNSREYLQLALAKVLELQRAVNDDSYFNDNTSELGESDNEEDLMRHVLMKVFHDLPGSSNTKVTRIIDRVTRSRTNPEIARNRGKSIQLSGYDTCRRVALDFMKKSVKSLENFRNDDSAALNESRNHRRRSINDFASRNEEEMIKNRKMNYEIGTRMLSSLDLHLAAKQRDYTARLMRH